MSFSVGFTVTNQVKDAIGLLPKTAWTVAVESERGTPPPRRVPGCRSARSAELTGLLSGLTKAGWPKGMRVIVRRERPIPARSSHVRTHRRMALPIRRHQHPTGRLALLEARHRAHAHVEDRIQRSSTPASAGSRPGSSPSTPPGCSWL